MFAEFGGGYSCLCARRHVKTLGLEETHMKIGRFKLTAFAALAIAISSSAYAQVLPRNKTAAQQPATPATGEAAGQVRREGREEARETRADARKSASETGQEVRETARETRQEVRDTRQDARETARETRQATRQQIQATRGADFGLWFRSRGNDGLFVSDITPDSVFANIGLKEGDRIVSINGRPVSTEAQFIQILNGPDLGTQAVQIVVLRDGQQQTLTLQPSVLKEGIVNHDLLYQYGLVLDQRNPDRILVQRVFPRTPAYYAGIRQGDTIVGMAGRSLNNVNAFMQGLSQAVDNVSLAVQRAGQTRDLEMQARVDNDESSVRTALKPNLDDPSRANQPSNRSSTNPNDRDQPRLNLPTPQAAPSPSNPGGLAPRATPATPATPAVPATPGTVNPR
jgi:C-terminal processing protease CtpA/Prc